MPIRPSPVTSSPTTLPRSPVPGSAPARPAPEIGDRGPIGAGYDMGADQARLSLHLPLVHRSSWRLPSAEAQRRRARQIPCDNRLDGAIGEAASAIAPELAAWSAPQVRRLLHIALPLPPHSPERLLGWSRGQCARRPQARRGHDRRRAAGPPGGGIHRERSPRLRWQYRAWQCNGDSQ